jgi:hypothetical protein
MGHFLLGVSMLMNDTLSEVALQMPAPSDRIVKKKRRAFARRLVSMDARVKPGRLDPGSAAHHFVLRRARETGSVIQEAPQLP